MQSAGALAFSGFTPGWLRAADTGAVAKDDDRILVIVELSGGNDGLNTVVPYGDDAYYRHRPHIGIRPDEVLKLDDHYGFNPGMLGFERLWNSGDLAIVHGCGYDNPSYSHFTSMAYWHTAAPNGGDEFGWVGRLADVLQPDATPNFLINIDSRQSLAVKSRLHSPVVFDDPERFHRKAFSQTREILDELPMPDTDADTYSATRRYLSHVARSARDGSVLIQQAWARYRSPIDYGIVPMDLPKVAACIAGGLPTRLYYVAFRNNAFDTHVQQPALHRRLLSYACDAIHGFVRDMERLGLADRVVVMAFSEFGRRVPENSNLGTDHGAANLMFMAGKPVRGGHHGEAPSLTDLDSGDNLRATVDFRRVYATAIDGWLAPGQSSTVLKGNFETLPIFTAA
ncbi:MAG: DUF1501 domain-containing protein [Gammaproteobacteria bacterium]|nr:DUF1501 domain-containing protein [Gammaproteobacteria bacterium]